MFSFAPTFCLLGFPFSLSDKTNGTKGFNVQRKKETVFSFNEYVRESESRVVAAKVKWQATVPASVSGITV